MRTIRNLSRAEVSGNESELSSSLRHRAKPFGPSDDDRGEEMKMTSSPAGTILARGTVAIRKRYFRGPRSVILGPRMLDRPDTRPICASRVGRRLGRAQC